ncbi:MAG: hypothetical protein A2X94_03870 [Bdellovibrionales bacterium GWB1_55_8]|nr:MAG: hypothetical protein A2X94_03870 [Bdellovibrionales bacterium GWB1_55_8]
MDTRPVTYMKFFTALVVGLSLLPGCGSSGDDPITASEMATATVSGAVQGSSAGVITGEPVRIPKSVWEQLHPIQTAYAANTCPSPQTAIADLNCSVDSSGKVLTLVYHDCNFGNNSAVWNGSEILASNAAVSCGESPSKENGATLQRTFTPGTTRTVGNSVHVASLDTSEPSGYETPVSGGSLLTYGAEGSFNLKINGVHVLSQKIFRGNGNEGRIQTEADHTVSTIGNNMEVVAVNGTRVVNGTVQVQHNLEKYTGTSVFSDVVYSNTKGCCLPESGTVTTTFTGSRTGTEALTFSGTECGSANLKDQKGALKDLILTRCF